MSGSSGTAAAKAEALEAVGVRVGRTPSQTAQIARESSRANVTAQIGPGSARSVAAPGRFCHHWPVSERIREVPSPRRTTTTYVAGRTTIRVAVPRGWARGILAGVEAAFAGWAITTVVTMIGYLSLRSNTWMNDTTPRDALALGGDLWVAVVGGTSVADGVSYRVIPTLFGAFW